MKRTHNLQKTPCAQCSAKVVSCPCVRGQPPPSCAHALQIRRCYGISSTDLAGTRVRYYQDLLAMAPTGSGKTAVALLAILQAFARGQRAIYTSPIKALSNQVSFHTGIN
eukprot:2200903-Rhodomonas_salina.6